MLPNKIYAGFDENTHLESYCTEKKGKCQTEYIRKEALLEWAKELKERWEEPPMSKHSPGCVYMLEQLIDKLNSM